jgi:hypothetical protein
MRDPKPAARHSCDRRPPEAFPTMIVGLKHPRSLEIQHLQCHQCTDPVPTLSSRVLPPHKFRGSWPAASSYMYSRFFPVTPLLLSGFPYEPFQFPAQFLFSLLGGVRLNLHRGASCHLSRPSLFFRENELRVFLSPRYEHKRGGVEPDPLPRGMEPLRPEQLSIRHGSMCAT